MAEPDIPVVPMSVWRELLDQLVAYRKAEPWRWVPDSVLAAYVDASGQPWFACILGNGHEVYGLSLYRGANGLRLHRTVLEMAGAAEPSDVMHMQDALTVWYGTKSEVDPLQRSIYTKLGFAPASGDRLGWPHVRSHRPGLFPWFPDEGEVRALTAAIPAVLRFAGYVSAHPDCFEQHGPWDMPTLSAADTPLVAELEWRTWMTPEPDAFGAPVQIASSEPVMRRIAALPQANEVLELDWFYTSEPVVEDGRPFYPRAVVVFQKGSGYCYGAKIIGPEEDVAAVAAEIILAAVEQHGGRPAEILATKPELTARLAPLARSLGARTKTVRLLKTVTEFREGLEGGGRSARKRRGRP